MATQSIVEYDYYEAMLSVRVVTELIGAAASSVITAASVHEEYASDVRCALREYRKPLDPYLEFYLVRKIQPAGSIREVNDKTGQVILVLRFNLGIALPRGVAAADERKVFAFERNIEKATQDLFDARSIPSSVIPGDTETLGESFIDIVCECGPATEQAAWEITV